MRVDLLSQSAEVEFEKERSPAYEFQLLSLSLDSFHARRHLTVAPRYGWKRGRGLEWYAATAALL